MTVTGTASDHGGGALRRSAAPRASAALTRVLTPVLTPLLKPVLTPLLTLVLASALVVLAGPVRAAANAAPAGAAAARPSAHSATHQHQPGTADPPPAVPPPFDASGPAQVQALAQQYANDVKTDQQKADQLQTEKGTLDQRAGDIQSREDALTSQATDLKTKADALEKQAEDLDAAITAHNNAPHVFTLPDEEAEYEAYNAEKARLDAQKAALQSQLDGLNGQITKLQGDKSKADADQAQLDADIETHNDAVSALEQDVSRLADERRQMLGRIAELMQNFADVQQACTCSAATGADEAEPPAAAAPPPQARALPSGGGDQAAPARSPYKQVGGAAAASGASGPGASGPTPAPIVNPTPVRVTLTPSTVSGLSAKQTEDLSPSETFDGLIPEGNGNYAAAQVQPPPGASVPPGQKAFSDVINDGGKATTSIGGKPVTVDRVVPVTADPAANSGGDTPRPAAAPARSTQRQPPKWVSQEPVTQNHPPVSLDSLRSVLADKGLGDLADQYDFEYAPVIVDADGYPVYGSAPVDAAGNPLRGATGKPVFQFSNLGLQNPDQAVRTFTGDLVESDLALTGRPRFKEYQYLTGPQAENGKTAVGFRYQRLVTGLKFEEHWLLDGELIKVDGGPGANGYIYEAKWTGNAGDKKAPYYSLNNPQWDTTKAIDQAARLLALNRALGGPGVRYVISSPEGVATFTTLFQDYFASELASGELQLEYVPATGMK